MLLPAYVRSLKQWARNCSAMSIDVNGCFLYTLLIADDHEDACCVTRQVNHEYHGQYKCLEILMEKLWS